MENLCIGIDPGTHTGYAVWSEGQKRLLEVGSGSAVEVEVIVKSYVLDDCNVFLRIEDARKRKWYGGNADAKKQGAGSAKRDSKRWEEFCQYHEIPHEMIHPIKGGTKLDKDVFKSITGWDKRTNEHGRDAAMMVFNYKRKT